MSVPRAAAKRGNGAARRPRALRKADATATVPRDVLMQFRTIIRTIRHHYREVQERCGVSGSQLWALAAVGASHGIKVNDVARHLAIHQSTASNLLDKLERMNLVERRRSDDDRRVVCVYITPSGRALLRRAPKPAQGVLPGALQDLPARDLRALRMQLASLIDRMQLNVASAGMTPLADLLEAEDAPRRARGRSRP